MDLSILLSHLRSTSNLALSSACFNRLVRSNGFPIRTSEGELCLTNLSFYRSLGCPFADEWMNIEVNEAIYNDESDQLHLLLQHKADIEAQDKFGHTALMEAASDGRIKCLEVLLDHKADLEAKDIDGDTVLTFAAIFDKIDCVKLLLENGAKIRHQMRADWPKYFGEKSTL